MAEKVRVRYTVDIMVDLNPEDYYDWFEDREVVLPEDVLEAEKQLLNQEGPGYAFELADGARFVSAKVELDK